MALAVPTPGQEPPAGVALAPPLPRRRWSVAPPRIQTIRLSVVIVNFRQWRNTARLTRQLERSASARHGTSEILVVDNHSPPHPLRERLRRRPGVSLRQFGRNRGFARAVNEGCRLGRGEWCLVLNPDVSVPPGFLDRVLAVTSRLAVEQPRAGVVGFRLRNRDGTPQGSSGPFPTLARTVAGLLLPRSLRKCRPNPNRQRCQVPWVTGCCLLVRRECLRELGGLDEDFFLYYEDVDLCRRARQQGWSIWYEPDIELIHHWPLHARRVPPALRLVTRHALLTYGSKHWARWQFAALAGLVGLEAWARQRWARLRRQTEAIDLFGQLRQLVGDLWQGRGLRARRRVLEAARHLDRRWTDSPRTPSDTPTA